MGIIIQAGKQSPKKLADRKRRDPTTINTKGGEKKRLVKKHITLSYQRAQKQNNL